MANTKKKTTNKNKQNKSKKEVEVKETKEVEEIKEVEEETKEKKVAKKTTIAEEKIIEDKEVEKTDSNSNLAKGIIIVILLIAFFTTITLIGNTSKKGAYSKDQTTNNNENSVGDAAGESANISEDEMGDLKNIGIEEYLDIKENNEKYSIIYIGRPTCSHCEVQKPLMQHMVYKYNVEINYLNTDELDDDGIGKLQKSDDYFSEGWGTPLVLIVKGDKIIDKSEGETSIEELTEMFKEYDLINE